MKKYLILFVGVIAVFLISLPAWAQDTSTSESDIRQKVIKKVEEVLKKPKAYIGIVTDISSNNLQIKSDSSEIQQISVTPGQITVIKAGKVNKEIKLTDVAIGDFIVAMGFKNGNNVLNAKRILSTSALASPTASSHYGTVSKTDKKSLTLRTLSTGQETQIVVDKNTDINELKGTKSVSLTLSDINEEDLVIVIIIKDTQKARTIFVIKSSTPLPKATP